MKNGTNFLDELIEKINKGVIDRRTLLKFASAAGITVCAAVSGTKNSIAGKPTNCLNCHSQAPKD